MTNIRLIICIVLGISLIVLGIVAHFLIKKHDLRTIHSRQNLTQYFKSSIPLILGISGIIVLISLGF